MKYNAKYDRWVSKDGLIYRYDKQLDKLVLCSIITNGKKHLKCYTKVGMQYVHRIVWETFVDDIPAGMVIDHKKNNPQDNSISNLQCVTHSENTKLVYTRDGYTKPLSTFGIAFKLKYGIRKSENPNLYSKELRHWKKYGRLS